VAGCHGLASPQPPLDKYFFFPGFGADTGGLLCERELFAQRDAWRADPDRRAEWLARFGVACAPTTLLVSLFAYENAALPALLATWADAASPTYCLLPEGRLLPVVADFFGDANLAVGAIRRRGALTVAVLPFLTQDDYDRLLWTCNVNFVRGEDSFVRAQWAGRPFIWQIYPQPDGAHWPKLDAFLRRYSAALSPATAAALRLASHAWNGQGSMAAGWRTLQPQLAALNEHAPAWAAELAGRGNLAATLVQFCANHV
jgi:uncharacterized repeat protein (TIGR03837 family)